MTLNEMHARIIQVKTDWPDATKYNACLLNCEAKVEEFGGSLQYGWYVGNENRHYFTLINHVVWRKPDNELVCVTPQAASTWDKQKFIRLVDSIRFICDDNATMTGEKPNRMVRPSQYVPVKETPRMLEACRWMHYTDIAILDNNYAQADYYDSKAKKLLCREFGYARIDSAPPSTFRLTGC